MSLTGAPPGMKHAIAAGILQSQYLVLLEEVSERICANKKKSTDLGAPLFQGFSVL